MNRALALDKSHHLRHRILGRNRDHHMHMIGHQVPFLDPALLPGSQVAEHLSQVLAQLPIQRLASVLRDKDHVVFCTPTWCDLGSHTRPSAELSFRVLWRLTM